MRVNTQNLIWTQPPRRTEVSLTTGDSLTKTVTTQSWGGGLGGDSLGQRQHAHKKLSFQQNQNWQHRNLRWICLLPRTKIGQIMWLQASCMQQHFLLVVLMLSLLSHLPLRVATNQSVMVKDTLCQIPTNHCSIVVPVFHQMYMILVNWKH